MLPGTDTAPPPASPTLLGVPWQLELLLTLAGEGAGGDELGRGGEGRGREGRVMINVATDRCNPFTAGYVTVSLLADLTIHQHTLAALTGQLYAYTSLQRGF